MTFLSSLISIETKKIAFLKFIIEGYDGLATITTIDRSNGTVKLMYPAERAYELASLVWELFPSIQETELEFFSLKQRDKQL